MSVILINFKIIRFFVNFQYLLLAECRGLLLIMSMKTRNLLVYNAPMKRKFCRIVYRVSSYRMASEYFFLLHHDLSIILYTLLGIQHLWYFDTYCYCTHSSRLVGKIEISWGTLGNGAYYFYANYFL